MVNFSAVSRKEPYSGFRFIVFVNGGDIGQFSKVSGLTDETEVAEYREGADGPAVRKIPGLATYENIVLEKGITSTRDLIDWRQRVLLLGDTGGEGAPFGKSTFRADVNIRVLSNLGKLVREYTVVNAWPAKLEYDDLDATSSDILLERVELAHEGLSVGPSSLADLNSVLQGNIPITGQ